MKLNDFRQILNGEILENRYFDAFFVDKDGIEIGSRLPLIRMPGIGIPQEEKQLRRMSTYFLGLSGVQSADPLSLLLQVNSTSPDIVRQNMDARMSGKRKLAMQNILRMLSWASSF